MSRVTKTRIGYWIAVEKDRRRNVISHMKILRTRRLRRLAAKEAVIVLGLISTSILLPVFLLPMIIQTNVVLVGIGYLILGVGLLLMHVERRIYVLYHVSRILAKRAH